MSRTGPSREPHTRRQWIARGPWGSVFVAVAMGAGAIGAVIAIVFDRSDEAASAITLAAFLAGLILAAARVHRHRTW